MRSLLSCSTLLEKLGLPLQLWPVEGARGTPLTVSKADEAESDG